MKCEVCGNDYDRPLQVTLDGNDHVFDSFECAITALAPQCAVCDCRVIGHGVEVSGTIYCGAHCATSAGHEEIRDRA